MTRHVRPLAQHGVAAAAALAALALAASAHAYTAAGDRIFQASIVLPQIGPSDELYFRSATQPLTSGGPGTNTRTTNFSGVYDKTLTERLGVRIENGYNWVDRDAASTTTGWQNLEATVQYIAILQPENEFLFTVGVAREFGTGTRRIGTDTHGATTGAVYFGKGLGDVGVDFLRPIALKGNLGYQLADSAPRPDRLIAGLAIEYSLPYLESKVTASGLPAWLQNVTPQVEMLLTAPTRSVSGNTTAAVIAPGLLYAGEGWEFGIEALIPLNSATGSGAGVIAQLHFSLDYFFPTTIGAPLFSAR